MKTEFQSSVYSVIVIVYLFHLFVEPQRPLNMQKYTCRGPGALPYVFLKQNFPLNSLRFCLHLSNTMSILTALNDNTPGHLLSICRKFEFHDGSTMTFHNVKIITLIINAP